MLAEPSCPYLLLFDGVCHLCSASVQFVLRHDQSRLIHFCSIQSELGSKLYREQGLDPAKPQSMLFITPEGVYSKSDAALKLVVVMGGSISWFSCLKFIPPRLRDFVYSFIVTNRYRLFGKADQCWLPRPEWRKRFLS